MEFLQKPKLTRGSVLRFTPYSWAKLLYLRDIGTTEVGGYGICETDDPLLITDFRLVKQECTGATVELDEEDSSKFMEEMTDKGLSPFQYAGNWIHTHPGNSATPSTVDEENFQKNFSLPNMAVFFILARGGASYTRLRYNVGAGTEVIINSMVDYTIPFASSNHEAWKQEYKDKVSEVKYQFTMGDSGTNYRELMDALHSKGTEGFKEFETQRLQEMCDEKNEMDENLEMFWDHNEDCVWFYNEDEEDYWKYSPIERVFLDSDDSRISIKNLPSTCKPSEIIKFGFKCYKEQMEEDQTIEGSFLEEVDQCPYG
jgi:proteasome lid subunit RPN8/RPN11